jgi:tetratricopeptide (TPR) repeat protein
MKGKPAFPWIMASILLLLTTACETVPDSQPVAADPAPPPATVEPAVPARMDSPNLTQAIRSLAADVFTYITADINRTGDKDKKEPSEPAVVILDYFTNADSGEPLRMTQRIIELFRKEAESAATAFEVAPLTSKSLSRADYTVGGKVQSIGTSKDGECRNVVIRADIFHVETHRRSSVIEKTAAGTNIDLTPVSAFHGSPVFDGMMSSTRKKAFLQPKKTYGDSSEKLHAMETRALFNEALNAYEDGDYETARELYRRLEKRWDGKTLSTYSGLFLTHRKLGNKEAADVAFGKIVELCVSNYRKLPIHFHFKVNSVDFWEDEELRERYYLWLRHLGRQFADPDSPCMKIVGHCSPTGPEHWNKVLSLHRAKRIQDILAMENLDIRGKTQTIGKGAKEAIVGSGTDDIRDLPDRRVELIIVDCEGVKADHPFLD